MKKFKLFDDVEAAPASPSAQTTPQATQDTLYINGTQAKQDTRTTEAAPIDANKWAEYKDQQDADQKAKQLRTKISKGILAGANPHILLLQALECIGLMSGDKTFYGQTLEQIKLIYGSEYEHMMMETLPPEFELPEVRERLQTLQQYDLRHVPAEKGKWIIQAINLHKEREAYLIKQTESGK